jgi:hypothetical protein
VTIDPLHKAVDTLSDLLKRLWNLRQNGEFDSTQTKAIDQLVNETVASILSLVRDVREQDSIENRFTTNSSAISRKELN